MSVPALVRHDQGCKYARPAHGGHSDAARRVSDTWNLHLTAQASARALGLGLSQTARWFAVRLSDGSTDGQLYDTRREAITHQHHNENWYAYCYLQPCEMTVCMAESFLYVHRLAYDNGFRMADPDGSGHELIPALTVEDFAAQMDALARRDWIRSLSYDHPHRFR